MKPYLDLLSLLLNLVLLLLLDSGCDGTGELQQGTCHLGAVRVDAVAALLVHCHGGLLELLQSLRSLCSQ